MKQVRSLVFALTIVSAAFGDGPQFEVATIKPASMPTPADVAAGKLHVGMTVDAQRVDIGFLSLSDLTTIAFRVKRYQLVGPDWMTQQRWDIQAKIPDGVSASQVPEMLQALLAERFKLAVHRDSKEHGVYALVAAKGGSKLKEAEPDPDAKAADPDTKNQAVGVQVTRAGRGGVILGGRGGNVKMEMKEGGVMHFEMPKISMSGLADMLSPFLDRPVVDLTELKGNYHVELDLSMEEMRNAAKAAGMAMPGPAGAIGPGGPDVAKPPLATASDPSGSSIFQAVQRLGLKLEPRKTPMETIVVDHLEKTPTEN